MSSCSKWTLAVLLLALAFVAVSFLQVYLHEVAYLHPPRRSLRHLLEGTRIPNLREVEFPCRGGATLRGWFVPSENGAVIILVHGAMGDRTDVVSEMRVLASGGFGALAFDLPGHGESDGKVEWGQAERDALTTAVDWVAQQSGAESVRVGALGFSLGGYVVAQVAAEDMRIRAILLEATPSDVTSLTRRENAQLGRLSEWIAEIVDSWLFEPDTRKATYLVPRISPRPLLLIAGAEDAAVPKQMLQDLFDAAKEPKEKWLIPNAGHGNYHSIAGEPYAQRLISFFERLL